MNQLSSFSPSRILGLLALLVALWPVDLSAQIFNNGPLLSTGQVVSLDDVDARGGVPPNSTCEGATMEVLAVGGSIVRMGDNTGAPPHFIFGIPLVWEGFTITECANVTISYCGTSPAFQDHYPLLGQNCPLTNFANIPTAGIETTSCGDGNFTIVVSNLSPGVYYYAVRMVPGTSEGPYTLTITASACTDLPPANASCAGAVALTVGEGCNPTSGSTDNASVTGTVSGGCQGGDPSDGVWYSFVATGATHVVSVDPSAEFNAVVDVFSAPCAGGTLLDCAVAPNLNINIDLTLNGLTTGETYYVRVYDWYAGSSLTEDFTICVTGQTGDPCDANAGTLTADLETVCLVDDLASVRATANGDAVIPPGFSQVYILSSGVDMIMQQTGPEPTFEVTATSLYTVHTLVYDELTLDLSSFELGVSTIATLNANLIQGGGAVCASLDVNGAPVVVELCCDADAGTITADNSTICLLNGNVTVRATGDGNEVVLPGFTTAYVLTTGTDLVIIQTGTEASFEVTSSGLYTIHTLVYDELTLDLSTIEFGVTTGSDVNALLIQGGGTICASLDVAGAPIMVNDCSPTNDDCANAIELPINDVANCPGAAFMGDNTYATQEDGNEPSCDGTNAYFADVWYMFNSGDNTEVTIALDQMDMTDWAISVSDACTGGNEIACSITPAGAIAVATDINTAYWVRVYSNIQFGVGGPFGLCLSGDSPTFVCNGGTVSTNGFGSNVMVCSDDQADEVMFTVNTTSVEAYAFVIANANDSIITVLGGDMQDFNTLPVGTYHVWGVSYNGDLSNAEVDTLVSSIMSTGSCLSLSSNFVTVTVDICAGVVAAEVNNWTLYPNPTDGAFNLRYAGANANVLIEVIDMEGRLVVQERVAMARGEVYRVGDAGRLVPGMYTVRLLSGNAVKSLRLTVR